MKIEETSQIPNIDRNEIVLIIEEYLAARGIAGTDTDALRRQKELEAIIEQSTF